MGDENLFLVVTQEEFKMMKSDDFKSNMKYMERILNQSKYHKEYISYRNYPELEFSNKHKEHKRKMKEKKEGKKI